MFIDLGDPSGSAGGVEMTFTVTVVQLDRSADVSVVAHSDNGESAQGHTRLKFGDTTSNVVTLDVRPHQLGEYFMHLRVTVDPQHAFDQGGFTADDAVDVTVRVPGARPSQVTALTCG
jgi:hypothetical protein